MARAADALVAEIARRAGRATPDDIDDALAFLADQRRSSRTLSLAQVERAAGRLVERGWDAMKTQLALPGGTVPEVEVERIRVIPDTATNSLLFRASDLDALTIRNLVSQHLDIAEAEQFQKQSAAHSTI